MFSCVFDRAQKACANLNSLRSIPAFFFMLLTAAALSGCGGHSSLTNTTATNPVTPASTPLTVSATLPSATVGASYTGSVTATGGTAPYSFSVASGQLPAGVQLAQSTGSIAGTPTTGGSFNFAVSVADSKGASQQKSLQITVANNASSGSGGGSAG